MTLRHDYTQALEELNREILKMGVLVEEAFQKAMSSFVDQDTELARTVVAEDRQINEMEIAIEDRCISLIATEAPVASDLRRIVTGLKAATQLERIGDHAAHVAKAAIKLAGEPYMKPLVDLPRMAEICIEMIREGLDALVNNDAKKAVAVAMKDEMVDDLNAQVTRELFSYMIEDPRHVTQAIELLFVSRFIERSADHITNINEWTVYCSTGEHSELNI